MGAINIQAVQLQGIAASIATTPVQKYIQALIPYLEHRLEVAKALCKYKDNGEAEKQLVELMTYIDNTIKEVLNIQN